MKSDLMLMLIMLSYCLLCSFSFTEAREFRAEVIARRGIGLVIPSPESKPYGGDIIHNENVRAFKMYRRGEVNMQKLTESTGKVDAYIIGRSLKEKVMVAFNPMDHSPGVGHDNPPPSHH